MRRRRCLRTCLKTKNSAGGGVTFRVPFIGKTASGSLFFESPNPLLRPERSRKSSQKWLQKKWSENGDITINNNTNNNGQILADLDPGRGPAYLAKPVRDGPKKWPPKSCFSDHISRDCLNKRLVSLFKHILKQRLRRNEISV